MQLNTSDVDPDELADFIDDAADFMEEHGSCGGFFRAYNGSVCAVGALRSIYALRTGQNLDLTRLCLSPEHGNLLYLYCAATIRLNKIAQSNLEDYYPNIASFNDAHNHQERLDMMRKCAKELRQ